MYISVVLGEGGGHRSAFRKEGGKVWGTHYQLKSAWCDVMCVAVSCIIVIICALFTVTTISNFHFPISFPFPLFTFTPLTPLDYPPCRSPSAVHFLSEASNVKPSHGCTSVPSSKSISAPACTCTVALVVNPAFPNVISTSRTMATSPPP